jgi:hypothetical protein
MGPDFAMMETFLLAFLARSCLAQNPSWEPEPLDVSWFTHHLRELPTYKTVSGQNSCQLDRDVSLCEAVKWIEKLQFPITSVLFVSAAEMEQQ